MYFTLHSMVPALYTTFYHSTVLHSALYITFYHSIHPYFLTGFTTVHVNCALIRERPLSLCQLELGDLRGNIGVFRAVLSFSELRNVGVPLGL